MATNHLRDGCPRLIYTLLTSLQRTQPSPCFHSSRILHHSSQSTFSLDYSFLYLLYCPISYRKVTHNFFQVRSVQLTLIAHGTVHEHPHEAYASYFKLFTAVSILSTLLHLEAFTFAIVYNTPDRNYYRQSRILHFPYKKGYRSPFDRGITAFGKLFGALREHPAIGAVGKC